MAKDIHKDHPLREEGKLPESYSWNNMQVGIKDKLESLDEASNASNSLKLKWFSLFGFALITVCIGYYTLAPEYQTINKEHVKAIEKKISSTALKNENENHKEQLVNATIDSRDQVNSTQQKNTISINSTSLNSDNEDLRPIVNTLGGSNESKLSIESSGNEPLKDNTNSPITLSKLTTEFSDHEVNQKSSSLNSNITSRSTTLNTKNSNRQEDIKEVLNLHLKSKSQFEPKNKIDQTEFDNPILKEKSNQGSLIANINKLAPLGLFGELKSNIDLNLVSSNLLEKFKIAAASAKTDISHQDQKFILEIGPGVNFWAPNFKGSAFATKKKEVEKSIMGIGAGAKLFYQYNSNWNLSIGLDYQGYESRYEFRSERDTLIEQTFNVIEIDAATGDSTLYTRTTLGDAKAWNYDLQYNKYKSISIPIQLHRNVQIGDKISANLGIGGRYTLSHQFTGKTLLINEQDDSLYESSVLLNKDHYRTKNNFSVMGSFYLRYWIAERVYLGAGLNLELTLNNLSFDPVVQFNPIYGSGQIVIGYKF